MNGCLSVYPLLVIYVPGKDTGAGGIPWQLPWHLDMPFQDRALYFY